MTFLRRLFGGGSGAADEARRTDTAATADDPDRADHAATADDSATADDVAEHARDMEVTRADRQRLDDLAQRQLRYAQYAWRPPRQGSEVRADDAPDRADGGGA